jgi:alanine racemase
VLSVRESLESPLNMIRPGLMVYGLLPSPRCEASQETEGFSLRPVMGFKSRIAQIRELPADHPVSYAMTYRTPRAMRIAVVPVGYGHGYSWRLSNAGQVLIRGHRAPVVGRVTMDVTLVDVDDIPEASVGDEVVLFGSQDDASISVDEVADLVGTINYEIICGIGKRVTRVYIRNGRAIGMRTLTERRAVGGTAA